jgi:hypothetical protein
MQPNCAVTGSNGMNTKDWVSAVAYWRIMKLEAAVTRISENVLV